MRHPLRQSGITTAGFRALLLSNRAEAADCSFGLTTAAKRRSISPCAICAKTDTLHSRAEFPGAVNVDLVDRRELTGKVEVDFAEH
ncbi:MAG: hypothetical protein CML23_01375 [Rhizobiaceae bacterium]|nr:hypothetical protein [Rhizobiaceae bacterium]